METFTEAVDKFISSASWLTDEDAPMVAGLRIAGQMMDKKFSAATLAQFGLCYRTLMKKRPEAAGEEDELEALLNGA